MPLQLMKSVRLMAKPQFEEEAAEAEPEEPLSPLSSGSGSRRVLFKAPERSRCCLTRSCVQGGWRKDTHEGLEDKPAIAAGVRSLSCHNLIR